MKTGIDYISAERERQVNEEGWSENHDSEHTLGELALAAAYYAIPEKFRRNATIWPWHSVFFKPTPDDRIRELTKAGALIAAEIDRLLAIKQSK